MDWESANMSYRRVSDPVQSDASVSRDPSLPATGGLGPALDGLMKALTENTFIHFQSGSI
ncbi:MAG: hypothetical protein ABFD82_13350 [Syntrophaceae bacterium]